MVLLLGTLASCKKNNYKKEGLQKLENFGDNEGNLKGFYYEPNNATSNMPLVIVLHGCTQNALDVAQLTDWNKLADVYGFYVLYPEQKRLNNGTNCFNWFKPADFNKNSGENASIKEMLLEMQNRFALNTQQTYVTGLSAGGAMSMILISVYPDLFQGAAIMSGGPYKSATKLIESVSALNGGVDKTPEKWGDLVREQNPAYTGPYAKLAVFHGKQDKVVDFKNSNEILEQWSDVVGVSLQNPTIYNPTSDITQKDYALSNEVLLRFYEIDNMGHALAINPGNGLEEGGGNGVYSKDKDFFSSYWAGKYWGIVY